MTLASYDAEIEDSGREARSRERRALNHGIGLLSKIQSGELSQSEQADAFLFIRDLWAFFVQDLSNPRNGLPEQLRAQLISIGLWIVKEAERNREEQRSDVDDLVAVNIAIRDSLG
jgi:flagellar biosynthesis activator protein FlaF